ncbi:hypothetical protein D3C76_1610450 [compost metagenome]
MNSSRVPLEVFIIVLRLGFRLRLFLIGVNHQRGYSQTQILHRIRHQTGDNLGAVGLQVSVIIYTIGEIRVLSRIGIQEQVLCSSQANLVIMGYA